jgi:hypothetical protein
VLFIITVEAVQQLYIRMAISLKVTSLEAWKPATDGMLCTVALLSL